MFLLLLIQSFIFANPVCNEISKIFENPIHTSTETEISSTAWTAQVLKTILDAPAGSEVKIYNAFENNQKLLATISYLILAKPDVKFEIIMNENVYSNLERGENGITNKDLIDVLGQASTKIQVRTGPTDTNQLVVNKTNDSDLALFAISTTEGNLKFTSTKNSNDYRGVFAETFMNSTPIDVPYVGSVERIPVKSVQRLVTLFFMEKNLRFSAKANIPQILDAYKQLIEKLNNAK